MPLILELLRHGEALPAGSEGDAPRRLSPAGEQAIGRLARRLAAEGWRPDRAFTSPLRRARDSARLLLDRLVPPMEAEMMDELAGASHPEEILAALNERDATSGRVLLVGHQPLLGQLVAILEGGAERSVQAGSLLRVECPEGLRAGRCHVTLELRPSLV